MMSLGDAEVHQLQEVEGYGAHPPPSGLLVAN